MSLITLFGTIHRLYCTISTNFYFCTFNNNFSVLKKKSDIQTHLYDPCDIQIHLGIGLQPNNMAYIVPKPRPQAAFKPIEQMIFINSYYATPPGSHPVIYFPNKKVIVRSYYLSIARQCLGSITVEHIY